MFCSNCGKKLADDVKFCPDCGTKVIRPAAAEQGERVMLLSLGTCAKTTGAALLETLCGYTEEEALLIVENAPIVVARGLSEAQARFLAQALAEYGMEVSVGDDGGWRDWESNTTSVWDNAGELVTGVAAALGLLGLNNRISRDMMRRADHPYGYGGVRPPVYRLNPTLRTVSRRSYAPRPVVHRAPPPSPQAPMPGPRAVPTRPAGPGGNLGPRNTPSTPPQRPMAPGERPAGVTGRPNVPQGPRNAPPQRPTAPGERLAGVTGRPNVPGGRKPGGMGRPGGNGRG